MKSGREKRKVNPLATAAIEYLQIVMLTCMPTGILTGMLKGPSLDNPSSGWCSLECDVGGNHFAPLRLHANKYVI